MNSPCPRCGTPRRLDPRLPGALCDTCAGRVVCEHGRPVALLNAGLSGGVRTVHRDDDAVCVDDVAHVVVTIEGERFEAVERHLGGVAVITV